MPDKKQDKPQVDKQVTALPDGPPDSTGLTPRQQRVLAHIKDSIEKRGYPPSMREIGGEVDVRSVEGGTSVTIRLPLRAGAPA